MKKLSLLTMTALAVGTFSVAAVAGNLGSYSASKGADTVSKMSEKALKDKIPSQTIVETAAANANFSTLVTAVKAAGLADALSGEGPFTVFAPTNDAFAALPEGTVENLLKPENKEKLASILKYHVVSGKVKSGDIASGASEVPSLLGNTLDVQKSSSGVTVDGANVVTPDLKTSNGVIHVIDKVILPE